VCAALKAEVASIGIGVAPCAAARRQVVGSGPSHGALLRCAGFSPVYARLREAAVDPQHAFPGQGVMKPEQAELERLKKENAKLKMERDLLKKAAAYFAKESM
jgi:hypothetical protein